MSRLINQAFEWICIGAAIVFFGITMTALLAFIIPALVLGMIFLRYKESTERQQAKLLVRKEVLKLTKRKLNRRVFREMCEHRRKDIEARLRETPLDWVSEVDDIWTSLKGSVPSTN